MKVAVNIEFTDDELKKHAEDVGRRWALNTINDVFKAAQRFKFDPNVIAALRDAAANAFGGSKNQNDPGPRATAGIDAEFEPPTRCAQVHANADFDEGWACHHCGTYNALQRAACRNCAHERCDIVVPPPPVSSAAGDPSAH
jgi:hypothetical protein